MLRHWQPWCLSLVFGLTAGCGDNRLAAIDARPADAGHYTCGADVTVDDLALEVVASGLSEPVWAGAPPGDDRLFILERHGRVRVVKGGELLETPFLDLEVETSGAEQGLLTMAFPPDWDIDPRAYVYYSEPVTGASVIAEYRVDPADPDRAVTTERRLLVVPETHDYHNGGGMAFGPDGQLYLGIGDDGLWELPQDPASLLGKVLRLDVAAASPVPEVWALGFRNPWRLSFDRATGDLYIGDVGQKLREELDVLPAGSAAGANFGWPIREGTLCFNQADPYDDTFGPCSVPGGDLPPAIEYVRDDAAAVVGGHVYRGACMPGLAGTYFYSDNARNFIRTFRWSDGAVSDEVDLTDSITGDSAAFVTSFGEDAAGELYVVTYYVDAGPSGGVVSKIVPRP